MRKKVKIYVVERCEAWEPSVIMGAYSKLSNAKKEIKKLEKENKLEDYYFCYYELEIEDMYEKET